MNSAGEADSGFSVRQSIGKITRSQFSKVKNGIKQIVHQGFSRLKRLHEALSVDITSVHETLEASEYDLRLAIAEGEKECFFSQVLLPSAPGVFLEETLPDTEQVQTQVEKRGHSTMTSMALQTGYDFYKSSSRARALSETEAKKPYGQLICLSQWRDDLISGSHGSQRGFPFNSRGELLEGCLNLEVIKDG